MKLRQVLLRCLPFIAIAAGIVLVWSCSEPSNPGGPLPNVPPIARLSNVPPPQDTIRNKNPRLSLNWLGDDPDGYVTAFRYRWSFRTGPDQPYQFKPYTTILNVTAGYSKVNASNFVLVLVTQDPSVVPAVYKYFATLPPEGLDGSRQDTLARGDSITITGIRIFASNSDSIRRQGIFPPIRDANKFPVHVNPNGGIFIFDSPDTMNFHTFELSAIDNLGDTSSHPSSISFYTPQVLPPVTAIDPKRHDTSLVLLNRTATFTGVLFSFTGTDPNSRTIDYTWVVDRDKWGSRPIPWSDFNPEPTANVVASDFPDPYDTIHVFYVRSRNEFGAIDTIGDVDTFFTVYPAFARNDPPYQQKILFLNVGYQDPNPSVAHPTQAMVDDYYSAMLDSLGKHGRVSFSDVDPSLSTWPGATVLGNYSLVMIVGDPTDLNQTTKHPLTPGILDAIQQYDYVGGNLIMMGWSPTSPNNMPGTPPQPPFAGNVIHVAREIPDFVLSPQFQGAKGFQGYPDIALDPAKLDTAWHLSAPDTAVLGLKQIWATLPSGFGEYIYHYVPHDPAVAMPASSTLASQSPVGVRYRGVTFSCVFFGFPLYYCQQPQAIQSLRKALDDVGELNR